MLIISIYVLLVNTFSPEMNKSFDVSNLSRINILNMYFVSNLEIADFIYTLQPK